MRRPLYLLGASVRMWSEYVMVRGEAEVGGCLAEYCSVCAGLD